MSKSNPFGELLRQLLNITNEKTYSLSKHLGYDTTYISKWLNGSRLPSERSSDKVIHDIAAFFAERLCLHNDQQHAAAALLNIPPKQAESISEDGLSVVLYTMLRTKYSASAVTQDVSEKAASQDTFSLPATFLDKKSDLFTILKNAIIRSGSDNKRAEILSTVDLYSLFEDKLLSLFDQATLSGLSVSLSMVIDMDRVSKNSEDYFDWIVKTINVTNAPILTLYHSGDRMYEHLIIVRDVIAFVLVMRESELVACSYTTDPNILLSLDEYCVATFHRFSRFLAPLEPAMLDKTILHVDFYMQDWGRILLYGAPSLFLPPSVIRQIIDELSESDRERIYTDQLQMLSHAWEQRMRYGDLAVILFKSCLMEYLHTGAIDRGRTGSCSRLSSASSTCVTCRRYSQKTPASASASLMTPPRPSINSGTAYRYTSTSVKYCSKRCAQQAPARHTATSSPILTTSCSSAATLNKPWQINMSFP